ncbi:MAG: hemolysin III family protein [Buchananella hordeovulneris]|nr:hemolysin III family protein [Buchananella hordeovulneris]
MRSTSSDQSPGARGIDLLKPHLRGWIHAATTPLALAASIVLVVLAPTAALKWASSVFLASSLLLFGISALYHRFNWKPTAQAVLRRLDHSNIFLLIAGTYTPLSVALLDPDDARVLLIVVWVGAAFGILGRVFFSYAPRWLYTPLYVILGWVALWYLPQFWTNGGPAIVWLVVAGGISYTLGALVYALKWPDLWPRWFGFHEVFHTFTVAGWVTHCVAAFLAVLGAR